MAHGLLHMEPQPISQLLFSSQTISAMEFNSCSGAIMVFNVNLTVKGVKQMSKIFKNNFN